MSWSRIRLIQERRRRGWSQAELARRSNIHRDAIAHWERGGRVPMIDNVIKLANALELSTDELLGRARQ